MTSVAQPPCPLSNNTKCGCISECQLGTFGYSYCHIDDDCAAVIKEAFGNDRFVWDKDDPGSNGSSWMDCSADGQVNGYVNPEYQGPDKWVFTESCSLAVESSTTEDAPSSSKVAGASASSALPVAPSFAPSLPPSPSPSLPPSPSPSLSPSPSPSPSESSVWTTAGPDGQTPTLASTSLPPSDTGTPLDMVLVLGALVAAGLVLVMVFSIFLCCMCKRKTKRRRRETLTLDNVNGARFIADEFTTGLRPISVDSIGLFAKLEDGDTHTIKEDDSLHYEDMSIQYSTLADVKRGRWLVKLATHSRQGSQTSLNLGGGHHVTPTTNKHIPSIIDLGDSFNINVDARFTRHSPRASPRTSQDNTSSVSSSHRTSFESDAASVDVDDSLHYTEVGSTPYHNVGDLMTTGRPLEHATTHMYDKIGEFDERSSQASPIEYHMLHLHEDSDGKAPAGSTDNDTPDAHATKRRAHGPGYANLDGGGDPQVCKMDRAYRGRSLIPEHPVYSEAMSAEAFLRAHGLDEAILDVLRREKCLNTLTMAAMKTEELTSLGLSIDESVLLVRILQDWKIKRSASGLGCTTCL